MTSICSLSPIEHQYKERKTGYLIEQLTKVFHPAHRRGLFHAFLEDGFRSKLDHSPVTYVWFYGVYADDTIPYEGQQVRTMLPVLTDPPRKTEVELPHQLVPLSRLE